LKDETAAGFDGVSLNNFKCVTDCIIKPLTYIYNLSIKFKLFPNKFKLAIVKPL